MTNVLPRYILLLLLAITWEAVSRPGVVSSAALPPVEKVATAWLDLVGVPAKCVSSGM
jgi:NitT/TauT family transport system permease protein